MSGEKMTGDDERRPRFHEFSTGGFAAAIPAPASPEFFVAPATADERNRIRSPLIPVACWRVDDVRFAFDSSFVQPETAEELKLLKLLREEHKISKGAGPPGPVASLYPALSVFGHADPSGDDEYNKALSGRRATAIYGLLIRDASLWERLFSNPAGGDKWGNRELSAMLAAQGCPAGDSGKIEPAVSAFQSKNGLPSTGRADAATRKALFLAYMDTLCGADFKLKANEDFLARGADADGKGDYQGCGEFNPVLLLSREEERNFEKQESKDNRNAAYGPDRRVMVMLFRPGSLVEPARWPCPRAKEATAGCRKRFWSDGEARRGLRLPGRRRTFLEDGDTFACRFYHRLATGSPCESGRESGDCFIFLKLFDDSFEKVLANQEYEIQGLTLGRRIRSRTAEDGIVRHEKIPDDHYALLCGGQTETVEVYYMSEAERYDGKPWFMRVRRLGAADGESKGST
ncbi:MAG: peptidoglycan-binding protein [Bryobacteraceae bacterium]